MSSIFIKRDNTNAFPKFILLNIYILHNEKSNYLESFFQQPLISTQMHLFLKEAHFVTALSKSNVCRSGPSMDMIVVIIAVPMFCLLNFFGLKLILIRLESWCVTYRSKVLPRETKHLITCWSWHAIAGRQLFELRRRQINYLRG